MMFLPCVRGIYKECIFEIPLTCGETSLFGTCINKHSSCNSDNDSLLYNVIPFMEELSQGRMEAEP